MSDLAGRKVKTVDQALSVFSDRSLNSASHQLEAGFEMQLGASSEFEGREWVEVILPEGRSFALASSVRSHTDIPSGANVNLRSAGVIECPHCGLANPSMAKRCDCGYDFTSRVSPTTRADAGGKSAWRSVLGWTLIISAVIVGLQFLREQQFLHEHSVGGDRDPLAPLAVMTLLIGCGIGLIRRWHITTIAAITLACVLVPVGIRIQRVRNRVDAERMALRAVQRINAAQVQYHSVYGRFAHSLTELEPPRSGAPNASGAGLINLFEAGQPEGSRGFWGHYVFELKGTPAGYSVTAEPDFGQFWSRYPDQSLVVYYSDQSLGVRENRGASATANSPPSAAVGRSDDRSK